MSMDVGQFVAAVRGMSRKIEATHLTDMRELGRKSFDILVRHSPVKTGQYRLSHRIGVGKMDRSFFAPRPPEDVTLPPPPQSDADAMMSGMKFGESLVVSNSVPHAGVLEFGGGKGANASARLIYATASVDVEDAASQLAATFVQRIQK